MISPETAVVIVGLALCAAAILVIRRLRRQSADLRAAADELSRRLHQSEAEREELRSILSSMSEGVLVTDEQQRLVLWNRAAERLFSLPRQELRGKALWQVVRDEQLLKSAAEVLAGGQRKFLLMEPDGARNLEVTLCCYPQLGRPRGMIIVAHDVTQSMQYQELRREFVANVSHELRTPLSVIKGFVETLEDGAAGDPARAKQYLATIHKHADQLTNLVDDLLELSRLESQPQSNRRLVDLIATARRAADLLLPAAQRKQQTLVLDFPHAIEVQGNQDYLERALTNLIDNAIKYTPEGGRIRVHASSDNGQAMIEVVDTGIGIPEADLPRIFERFYRVDRSRSREMGGTGLGLSIVKHIAQSHGGRVEVESRQGEGSTFRLVLPGE